MAASHKPQCCRPHPMPCSGPPHTRLVPRHFIHPSNRRRNVQPPFRRPPVQLSKCDPAIQHPACDPFLQIFNSRSIDPACDPSLQIFSSRSIDPACDPPLQIFNTQQLILRSSVQSFARILQHPSVTQSTIQPPSRISHNAIGPPNVQQIASYDPSRTTRTTSPPPQ